MIGALLLAVDRVVRVEPAAVALVIAAELTGRVLDATATAAERYAAAARWWAGATRCVP